jgi:hypothetical protein
MRRWLGMEDPGDLRVQAGGWRILAAFYGRAGEALLETARMLEVRADRLEAERADRAAELERPRKRA